MVTSLVGVNQRGALLRAVALLFAAALCAATCPWGTGNLNAQEVGSQEPRTTQQSAAPAAPGAGKSLEVTYQDGKLTILAENSSLSEVLFAVRAATGTNIELPGGAAPQRIWIHLGPAPARQALRDLLDSTEFNYVIQASDSDPEGVRSVSLTARNKDNDNGGQGTQVARSSSRRGIPGGSNAPEAEQPAEDATTQAAAPTSVAAATPPGAPSTDVGLPDALPLASQLGKIQPLSPNGQPGTVKPLGGSPSEMIQQLQSMYEQRRQLQIQQNQKSPAAN